MVIVVLNVFGVGDGFLGESPMVGKHLVENRNACARDEVLVAQPRIASPPENMSDLLNRTYEDKDADI